MKCAGAAASGQTTVQIPAKVFGVVCEQLFYGEPLMNHFKKRHRPNRKGVPVSTRAHHEERLTLISCVGCDTWLKKNKGGIASAR